MSIAPAPRKPQSFSPDDPALVAEPDLAHELLVPAAAVDPATGAGAGDAITARPSLAELSERGLKWGKVLMAALAGAALLGAGASFARLISTALVREDWIGRSTLGLLLMAGLAAVMVGLHEIVGLVRLARLNRLRAEVDRALSGGDRKRDCG